MMKLEASRGRVGSACADARLGFGSVTRSRLPPDGHVIDSAAATAGSVVRVSWAASSMRRRLGCGFHAPDELVTQMRS